MENNEATETETQARCHTCHRDVALEVNRTLVTHDNHGTWGKCAGSSKYGPTKPEVGMGATEVMYSDRHPYTIIEIVATDKTGYPTKIRVQADDYRRTDDNGMSESQSYEYAANPQGEIHELTLRKNWRWVVVGQSAKNGQGFAIGSRSEYHDYSF